jgi:hypothetical protein
LGGSATDSMSPVMGEFKVVAFSWHPHLYSVKTFVVLKTVEDLQP